MNAALFPDLTVNGETVPHAVVATEAQNHAAPKGKPEIAWRKAARAVAARTLLLQEAPRRGLATAPAEISPGQFETDEEALIRDLLDQALTIEAPSDDAIHAEWARDPSRFRAPPLWDVSHILVACLVACDPRDEAGTGAARAWADALATRVLGDAKRFAQLAAEHSDCGSRASGGALGQLGPGDTVPEFEAVLRGMAEGEITPAPVLTRHDWHIIRMDGAAEGAELPSMRCATRSATQWKRPPGRGRRAGLSTPSSPRPTSRVPSLGAGPQAATDLPARSRASERAASLARGGCRPACCRPA